MSKGVPAPPENVPEGARAVVVAFAQPGPRGKTHHTYELWIVDAQSWTERLLPQEAVGRLIAEGYTPSRANGKLAQARRKARNCQ